GIRFRIPAHGAELITVEDLVPQSDSLLAIEDWALRIELDRQDYQRNDRQHQEQENGGSQNRKQTPQQHEAGAETKSFGKDQPAGIEVINLDLSGNLLQPGCCFFDGDSTEPQLKHLHDGKGAAAIFHRNNHAVDSMFAN